MTDREPPICPICSLQCGYTCKPLSPLWLLVLVASVALWSACYLLTK